MIYGDAPALPGFEHMTLQEAECAAFQMGHPAAGALALAVEGEQATEAANNALTHIQEAAAQYPNEDFLAVAIDDLGAIAKHLRGPNKAALLALVEKLEGIQTDTFNSSEYGREELRKAETELEG